MNGIFAMVIDRPVKQSSNSHHKPLGTSHGKYPISVHLEWAPGMVKAVNITTGEVATGTNIAELSSLLHGHHRVLVGVNRNFIFLKTLRLPNASAANLRQILDIQITQIFPLPADQLAYDFYQTIDTDSEGVLTFIAAMRADDLKQLRSELSQAGLTAAKVMPVALAAPIVAAHADAANAVVVEESTAGLTFDVVQGGVVRSSRVAINGSDPRLEVQRILAANRNADLTPVCAGDAILPDTVVSPVTVLDMLHEAPSFNFQLNEDRINEINQRVSARNRFSILMLLSAILLVTLVWVDRSDANQKVQKSQAIWNRQLTQKRANRNITLKYADQLNGAKVVIDTAFKPGQRLSDVLGSAGDCLPPNAWFTSINVERGKSLKLRGVAKTSKDTAKFVQAMSENNRFRDVRLVMASSAIINKTPVVEFNVTAVCAGNIPLTEPVKTSGRSSKTTGGSIQ